MEPRKCFWACSSFSLATVLAFILQILLYSPISPEPLELPQALSDSNFPTNSNLQCVDKIGEGFFKDPEDVCVDKEGVLYSATRDGWIKRLHRNGSLENWKMIGGDTLLGLTATMAGGIIVCDSEKGLLKVDDDGITILASHVNGTKISFADDVVEGSDGSLYFSVASTKFGLHNWYLDVLEAKPHGQLLKYDPSSKQTTILLNDLCFANGVALSPDEDYLVVCESWKLRCLKYWLRGERMGKIETFIDNLPGGPDNINLAPDGSFWIALVEIKSEGLEFVHKYKALKHLIATFSKLGEIVEQVKYKKARVVNVAEDGKILRYFEDPSGSIMSFVTSALEFENHLYLGSLNSNFIGRLPLKPEDE